jgi:hypothetical protein
VNQRKKEKESEELSHANSNFIILRPTPIFVWWTVVTLAPTAVAMVSNSSTLPPTPKYNTFAATRIVAELGLKFQPELKIGLIGVSLPMREEKRPWDRSGVFTVIVAVSVAVAFDKMESKEGTFALRYIVSDVITRS